MPLTSPDGSQVRGDVLAGMVDSELSLPRLSNGAPSRRPCRANHWHVGDAMRSSTCKPVGCCRLGRVVFFLTNTLRELAVNQARKPGRGDEYGREDLLGLFPSLTWVGCDSVAAQEPQARGQERRAGHAQAGTRLLLCVKVPDDINLSAAVPLGCWWWQRQRGDADQALRAMVLNRGRWWGLRRGGMVDVRRCEGSRPCEHILKSRQNTDHHGEYIALYSPW